ncbi:B-type lectin plumieribetin-like [Chironomus tepperi]|uniref:B-type lectin plumieribetin-like n=1 Tax=Chironomus tepperi TaxID=113505 RepID=UPI00391F87AE
MINLKYSLLLLLISATTILARSVLESGADIGNEEMLVSDNNRYFLRLEKSGDLAVYDKKDMKKKFWSSKTEGSESKMLYMQGDGNLVLYKQGQAMWHTDTASRYNRGDYLKLENDGTLNIYHKSTDDVIWTSKDRFYY